MTLAHLSDTHLGFRAYGRTTPQGFNVRELDVMETFRTCLRDIGKRDPDIVIHAGDLFHVVRPSNETIVQTHRALADFQRMRKGKPFVLIGGNHDTPRTAEAGNILKLFSTIEGLFVAPAEFQILDLPALNLEVHCVPSPSLRKKDYGDLRPSGNRPYSILSVHGMAKESLPDHSDFEVSELHPDRWTYVALGDYHVHQKFGRNACYPGSIDFTSTNIWEETVHDKGWVWYDTEKAKIEFMSCATRKIIDLPKIDADGMDGDAIGEAMVLHAGWDEIDLPIVRQVVFNVHPDVRSTIPQPVVRELTRRTLAYRLDFRLMSTYQGGAARMSGESLEASWHAHIAQANLAAGVDRARVAALGQELLEEVRDNETAAASA